MLKTYSIDLFRERISTYSSSVWVKRTFELAIKSVIVVCEPLPIVLAVDLSWYYIFYRYGIHLHPETEGVVTAALIPILGIIMGLFAAALLTTAWTEWKLIRRAVKRNDLEAFVDLRDESIPPLLHAMMVAQAVLLTGCFMVLHYTSIADGLFCVSVSAYILTLYFAVVIEMDDPCSGTWFIKSIPDEWLLVDLKRFRIDTYGKLPSGGMDRL